ncbi:hypothetical protein [Hymenobacter caeli]|uniref:hypothetical protein n=1 Tax=Hymenobacter caeli TaxID=2735894 RepID=UPI0036D3DFCA
MDILWLTRFQRTSFNVTSEPWDEMQPLPPLFQPLWAARLVKTFQQWSAELADRYPSFYLALELHSPDKLNTFRQSRLVVRVGEQQAQDDSRYRRACTQPLPALYQTVPGIDALQWLAYEQLFYYTPEEFVEYNARVPNKPFWEGTTAHGNPCIVVLAGWFWVGQAPGTEIHPA